MTQILFQNELEIDNDWLFYIENEAYALSREDEFAIQNYADREIFNPEMMNYLSADGMDTSLKLSTKSTALSLNFKQEMRINGLPAHVKLRFKNLKDKVRKIFCEVVQRVEGLDTKGIIKTVLIALIPAFATGIPALVLPIVIGLIAFLLKYGIERTCPV